jgi:hypothetical protein
MKNKKIIRPIASKLTELWILQSIEEFLHLLSRSACCQIQANDRFYPLSFAIPTKCTMENNGTSHFLQFRPASTSSMTSHMQNGHMQFEFAKTKIYILFAMVDNPKICRKRFCPSFDPDGLNWILVTSELVASRLFTLAGCNKIDKIEQQRSFILNVVSWHLAHAFTRCDVLTDLKASQFYNQVHTCEPCSQLPLRQLPSWEVGKLGYFCSCITLTSNTMKGNEYGTKF